MCQHKPLLKQQLTNIQRSPLLHAHVRLWLRRRSHRKKVSLEMGDGKNSYSFSPFCSSFLLKERPTMVLPDSQWKFQPPPPPLFRGTSTSPKLLNLLDRVKMLTRVSQDRVGKCESHSVTQLWLESFGTHWETILLLTLLDRVEILTWVTQSLLKDQVGICENVTRVWLELFDPHWET